MTAINIMTRFEKQRQVEKRNTLASTRCKICRKPIGEKSYMTYEERYFHEQCLNKAASEID